MRTSPKNVFVGVRLNKSLDALICAAGENKSAFIRTAIERYLLTLADLDTAV